MKVFFFLHIIREAQEHHRNVELHLYRKICLLVHPSLHVKSWKKVKRTHLLVDQTCFSKQLRNWGSFRSYVHMIQVFFRNDLRTVRSLICISHVHTIAQPEQLWFKRFYSRKRALYLGHHTCSWLLCSRICLKDSASNYLWLFSVFILYLRGKHLSIPYSFTSDVYSRDWWCLYKDNRKIFIFNIVTLWISM